MKDITTGGWIVGAVAWVALVIIMAMGQSCLDNGSCGGGSLFLQSILSIAMLAPSYGVALVASTFFPKRDPDSTTPGFWSRNGDLIVFYGVVIAIVFQAVGSGDLW